MLPVPTGAGGAGRAEGLLDRSRDTHVGGGPDHGSCYHRPRAGHTDPVPDRHLMELRRQVGVLRHWAWLIVLCVILAGGASYLVSVNLPKSYEAKATLIVGQSLTAVDPDIDQLMASQRLSQTYAAVAAMRPTLQRVIESLGLPLTPNELRGKVSAAALRESTLIEIRASDVDPVVAATIANAIADELIAASPAIQGQNADNQAFIDRQLTAIQLQIAQIQDETDLLASLSTRTSAQDQQLETLQSRITQLRSAYASLLGSSSNSAANLLTLADPAVPPEAPSSPRVLLNTLLAALVGLLLAVGIAFLVEYLDDTLKSPDDVAEVAGLPTLGVIARVKPEKGQESRLTTLASPRGPNSEAFRTLRTNLGFASVDAPLQVMLVTSAMPGEGKTTVACNLAIVFAQAGKRVILLDADLRRPKVHRIFQLPNSTGLSTLLRAEAPAMDSVAHQVQDGLRVITTGPLPPNPAELLGSQRMKEMLGLLKGEADIVIVDSPPLQAVTDAAVLATDVDGTLLIVDAGRTRKGAVRQAREALDRVEARVLGLVLNKLTERAGSYYYYADYKAGYGAEASGTGDQPSPSPATPDGVAPR